MKIGYDNSGNITAVTIDSEQLGAPNVLSVTDDNAYLAEPGKYVVDTGAVVRKRYLDVSTTTPTVAAGVSVTIDVASFLGTEVADTSGADEMFIFTDATGVSGYTSPITLASGVASFSLTSSSAQTVRIVCSSSTAWVAPLTVEFT